MTKDYLDISLLIQCIQRAEGNPDCFRRASDGCRESACCWRPYCLDGILTATLPETEKAKEKQTKINVEG